jgi:hypothetical protein
MHVVKIGKYIFTKNLKKDLHIFASTQKNKVLFNGYVNNNTTGVACGAGTANPYDVPEFTPGF